MNTSQQQFTGQSPFAQQETFSNTNGDIEQKNVKDNQMRMQHHPSNHYANNNAVVKLNNRNNNVIMVPPGQQVIIVNNQQNNNQSDYRQLQRESRIGCCCISVHNDCYCCNIFCMHACCRRIQTSNLMCYCHNCDWIVCCSRGLCDTCCLNRSMCQCIFKVCCQYSPVCLLFNCLKEKGCIQCCCNNICCLFECLKGINCSNCDVQCVGEIFCCIFQIFR